MLPCWVRNKSFSRQKKQSLSLIHIYDIIICDPEAEYFSLVQRLGGQVIRLSPAGKGMDLSLIHIFLKRRELKVKIINTGYMVRAPTPCAYRGRKPHPYN